MTNVNILVMSFLLKVSFNYDVKSYPANVISQGCGEHEIDLSCPLNKTLHDQC